MAIIGFEDQVAKAPEKEISEADKLKMQRQIEQSRKSLYLSPKRLAEIELGYGEVVVHDFGDEYHLSDAEREAQNIFYKQFAKLTKCKRKYRKLDEYVDCARISLACLDAVAQQNTVYDPDKFKSLVMKGKINIAGWMYPKYTGRDRKKINWDYIGEFILSDKDPSELTKKRDAEIPTEEEIEENIRILFDEGELETIISSNEEKLFKEESMPFDEDEDVISDGSTITIINSDKENKSLIKAAPELLDVAKEIRRELKSDEQLSRFISDIRRDDLQRIEQYDNSMNFASSSDIPKFKGDILSQKDYDRYIRALELYEKTQTKVSYNGKMRTPEEIQELQLKDALADAGWNIRALYDNAKKEKRLEKARKADEKREKKLKKQLTAVQRRSKRRMSDFDEKKSISKKKGKRKKRKKEDD